jgi:hypothetical protein
MIYGFSIYKFVVRKLCPVFVSLYNKNVPACVTFTFDSCRVSLHISKENGMLCLISTKVAVLYCTSIPSYLDSGTHHLAVQGNLHVLGFVPMC